MGEKQKEGEEVKNLIVIHLFEFHKVVSVCLISEPPVQR